MENYQSVVMHPVAVTAETLQIIAKQPNCDKLMTLYMHYVEVTTWQKNNSVRATNEFMSKRLSWHKDTIQKYKKALLDLGLIENITRYDDKHQVEGHYVLIRYVIPPQDKSTYPPTPAAGSARRVVSSPPSANKLTISTINLNKSTNTDDSSFQIALEEFAKMRRAIRKPLTPHAKELIARKLQKLYPNNESKQIACLEQSIANSWQGIFELKDETVNLQLADERRKPDPAVIKRLMEAQREYERRMYAYNHSS